MPLYIIYTSNKKKQLLNTFIKSLSEQLIQEFVTIIHNYTQTIRTKIQQYKYK